MPPPLNRPLGLPPGFLVVSFRAQGRADDLGALAAHVDTGYVVPVRAMVGTRALCERLVGNQASAAAALAPLPPTVQFVLDGILPSDVPLDDGSGSDEDGAAAGPAFRGDSPYALGEAAAHLAVRLLLTPGDGGAWSAHQIAGIPAASAALVALASSWPSSAPRLLRDAAEHLDGAAAALLAEEKEAKEGEVRGAGSQEATAEEPAEGAAAAAAEGEAEDAATDDDTAGAGDDGSAQESAAETAAPVEPTAGALAGRAAAACWMALADASAGRLGRAGASAAVASACARHLATAAAADPASASAATALGALLLAAPSEADVTPAHPWLRAVRAPAVWRRLCASLAAEPLGSGGRLRVVALSLRWPGPASAMASCATVVWESGAAAALASALGSPVTAGEQALDAAAALTALTHALALSPGRSVDQAAAAVLSALSARPDLLERLPETLGAVSALAAELASAAAAEHETASQLADLEEGAAEAKEEEGGEGSATAAAAGSSRDGPLSLGAGTERAAVAAALAAAPAVAALCDREVGRWQSRIDALVFLSPSDEASGEASGEEEEEEEEDEEEAAGDGGALPSVPVGVRRRVGVPADDGDGAADGGAAAAAAASAASSPDGSSGDDRESDVAEALAKAARAKGGRPAPGHQSRRMAAVAAAAVEAARRLADFVTGAAASARERPSPQACLVRSLRHGRLKSQLRTVLEALLDCRAEGSEDATGKAGRAGAARARDGRRAAAAREDALAAVSAALGAASREVAAAARGRGRAAAAAGGSAKAD